MSNTAPLPPSSSPCAWCEAETGVRTDGSHGICRRHYAEVLGQGLADAADEDAAPASPAAPAPPPPPPPTTAADLADLARRVSRVAPRSIASSDLVSSAAESLHRAALIERDIGYWTAHDWAARRGVDVWRVETDCRSGSTKAYVRCDADVVRHLDVIRRSETHVVYELTALVSIVRVGD